MTQPTLPPAARLLHDLRRLEEHLTPPAVPAESPGPGASSEAPPASRGRGRFPAEPTPFHGPAADAGLAAFGDPRQVGHLLRVLLGTLLRRGPGRGPRTLHPARLISAAAEGARRGELSVHTPELLRRDLREAQARVVEAGAWNPGAEPWWHPLPPPSPLEALAAELAADLRPLEAEDLRSAFGKAAGDRRWWVQSPLLDPRRTRAVYLQLEEAYRQGALGLEAGAVGARGKVSVRRSDHVTYCDGSERELLEAAPDAALLIQHLLRSVPEAFASAFPGKPLYPPQRAMLARYPAPSAGYHAHLDNPGDGEDNDRAATLVLYLNPPEAPSAGGGLSLWGCASDPDDAPDLTLPAAGGTAAVFDSRRVPHRVEPLGAGPARWALTLWLSELPQAPPAPRPPPAPSVTELLLPLPDPPLPKDRVLFHRLDVLRHLTGDPGEVRPGSQDRDPRGRIVAGTGGSDRPRAGIVCTTYRAGEDLLEWCEHHLGLGFVHLVLIFDHLPEPGEGAVAREVRRRFGPRRVTVWDGEHLLREALGDGAGLEDGETRALLRLAAGGGSSHAHAARQTLNATRALRAARDGELGGGTEPLTWLLHLDDDERFHLEGAARGGASLRQHFAAARRAGWLRLTYANHELLLPWEEGAPRRYKVNPRLAAARLGTTGWRQLEQHLRMSQEDLRPYFRAYHNGKSAVFVPAAARAAGVHGWQLREGPRRRRQAAETSAFLAGPSILHRHLPTAESFCETYLAKARAPRASPSELPFRPSPLEEAALEAVGGHRHGSPEERDEELASVYRRRCAFSAADIELLEAAGLLWEREHDPSRGSPTRRRSVGRLDRRVDPGTGWS